jgi:cyclic pyranopterin phosphate synthase
MLQDTHHRTHNYLRISLTDACNFRCFYCMPDEEVEVTPQSSLMSADEIEQIASVFVSMGVTKIRLTGGEPLVRKDVDHIIRQLAKLPVKLTLTTNGVLLDRHMDVLQQNGVQSVNVSLDTLNPVTFLALTKRDQFDRVRANIDLLLQRQFSVKVNVVVINGINTHELLDFVEWTHHQRIHVRFIEFMPFDRNQWGSKKVFTYQQILDTVSSVYSIRKLKDGKHDTTKAFQVEGHLGTFAVISTMTMPFCSTCNRLRLTADGKMKNCLFSKTETDLLSIFRQGADIRPAIIQNVLQKEKALGGQWNNTFTELDSNLLDNRTMIAIGG